jgi:hypothetical protein
VLPLQWWKLYRLVIDPIAWPPLVTFLIVVVIVPLMLWSIVIVWTGA